LLRSSSLCLARNVGAGVRLLGLGPGFGTAFGGVGTGFGSGAGSEAVATVGKAQAEAVWRRLRFGGFGDDGLGRRCVELRGYRLGLAVLPSQGEHEHRDEHDMDGNREGERGPLAGNASGLALAVRAHAPSDAGRPGQQPDLLYPVALEEVEHADHVLVTGALVGGNDDGLAGDASLLRANPLDEIVLRHGERRRRRLLVRATISASAAASPPSVPMASACCPRWKLDRIESGAVTEDHQQHQHHVDAWNDVDRDDCANGALALFQRLVRLAVLAALSSRGSER
jgi:hypothetical protein